MLSAGLWIRPEIRFDVTGAVLSSTREKIIVLEPYFGGSHKAFLRGLEKHLDLDFEFHTLPARKWKWRMRLAAPYFADKLHKQGHRDEQPGNACILCSTFVDVAAFRSLAPDWAKPLPLVTYFHENQFAYPVQVDDERDYHFAVTNFTTALASDLIAFNSQHNLSTFLIGLKDFLKKTPDMKFKGVEHLICNKSRVLFPGQDFEDIDRQEGLRNGNDPVILWNHRWEHDKQPEIFFEALYSLDQKGFDFKLIVAGESFKQSPAVFKQAENLLAKRILHFGHARSRKEYVELLRHSDIVVSTANHEFFGIAVIEAVRAGCRPLLPGRLSYPELFPAEFLYDADEDFQEALISTLAKGRLSKDNAHELTERFSWNCLADQYREWLHF
ncbi:MAG: DUF3524 domain-containing protein [Proteobacteria bacterium]|nr:DUF3524 domain-containing protein [Pseudomonadota bacterium]MBU1709271.1 DUF3524 domain-containing protein [Pseudomonadota bacterium]